MEQVPISIRMQPATVNHIDGLIGTIEAGPIKRRPKINTRFPAIETDTGFHMWLSQMYPAMGDMVTNPAPAKRNARPIMCCEAPRFSK